MSLGKIMLFMFGLSLVFIIPFLFTLLFENQLYQALSCILSLFLYLGFFIWVCIKYFKIKL